MIDAIGLGDFLFNLGILISLVVFVLILLLVRFVFKKSWIISLLSALLLCSVGFFSSPYVFSFFLHLAGYSFIG